MYNLRASNVGCYIGNVFLGSLGYADDLCLLSPNRGSMSIMLNSCDYFSKEYDVVLNPSNTHLIIYDERRKYQKMEPLCLNGETLNIQRVAPHLGHPVDIDNVNSITIRNVTRYLIWRTNYVIAKFGFCSADVCAFMFRTYCTSYYGSPLWQLDSNDVKGMVLISN